MVNRPVRSALTLVELVVVLGIIGVLIGLMIPAVIRVRETANASACRSNMRQIGIALADYRSTHGSLPLGSENHNDTWGAPGTTWAVRILPHLDYQDIHRKIDFNAKDASGQVFANTANSMSASRPGDRLRPYRLSVPGGRSRGRSVTKPEPTVTNYLGFFGTYLYGSERSNGAFGVNFGRPFGGLPGRHEQYTVVVANSLTASPE